MMLMKNVAICQSIPNQSVLRIDSIESKVWNEKRDIKVFLPLEYFDSESKLPVMYILDGQSREMFSYCSAIVDYLIAANLLKPFILVGISTYDRVYELTPTPNGTKNKYSKDQKFGGAPKTISYIENELIPYVKEKYRTNDFSVILGHSLGASLATNIFIKNHALFNAYILASPNYTFDNEFLVRELKSMLDQAKSLQSFFYLGYGNSDETETKFKPSIEKVKTLFSSKVYSGFSWKMKMIPSKSHAITPFEAFPSGLIELNDFLRLKDVKFYELYIKNKNTFFNNIKTFYTQKSKWANCSISPTEDEVNQWGYFCIEKKDYINSGKLFAWGIELYPDSYNLYDSQGESLFLVGKIDAAIKSFKESLLLLDKKKNVLSQEDYTYYKKVFNDHLKKAETEKPKIE